MSGDLSLFGDDDDAEPSAPVQPAPTEASIPDWLVNQLREALTARGLTATPERQQAVEDLAGRPVESLRSLTRAEAMRALERLSSQAEPPAQSASAWDDRDEDTWIDRL